MKSEFEQQDIEVIAQRVKELLKPMLSGNGKNETEDTIFDVQGLAGYLMVTKKWNGFMNEHSSKRYPTIR
jgi:hypothetical protein